MDIHISRDGQRFGPYPIEDARQHLAAGQLLATDLAWHEGAPDWIPLGDLLNQSATPAVPPPPGEPAGAAAPAVSPEAAAAKKKKTMIVRIVLLVVLVLVAVGVGLEHLARSGFESAYKLVEQEMNSGKSDGPAALAKKLGREPDSTEQAGSNSKQVYEWAGTLNVYTLEVLFSGDEVEEMAPKKKSRFGGGEE